MVNSWMQHAVGSVGRGRRLAALAGMFALSAGAGVAGAQQSGQGRVGPFQQSAPELELPPSGSLSFLSNANGPGAPAWNTWLTPNGQAVVAQGTSYEPQASVWTREQGVQVIGPAAGAERSWPYGSNSDGSVIVGGSSFLAGSIVYRDRAFRWTRRTGTQDLGVLPGDLWAQGYGVSEDGRVVVGQSTGPTDASRQHFEDHGFIWTAGVGMRALPAPTWARKGLLPGLVNTDGSVVAGVSGDLYAPYQYHRTFTGYDAFVWTAGPAGQTVTGGTLAQLPELPGVADGVVSMTAMNDTGTIMVGTCTTFSSTPTMWRQDAATGEWTAMALGSSFDARRIVPLGVSRDGGVVVGALRSPLGEWGDTAVFWTPSYGWQPLDSLVTRMGNDLHGVHLASGMSVSADGTSISGYGVAQWGSQYYWTVSGLTAIPAPSTYWLAGFGAAVVARRRR